MKAIICTAYGLPDVLQLGELATPEPKRGQVRIRMRATAVTYSDCLARGLAVKPPIRFVARLILGHHRPRRQVLGIVVAREIDRVGAGVKAFREGDHRETDRSRGIFERGAAEHRLAAERRVEREPGQAEREHHAGHPDARVPG